MLPNVSKPSATGTAATKTNAAGDRGSGGKT